MDDKLKQMREVAEKATPGPWLADLDVFDDEGLLEACVSNEAVSILFTADTDVSNDGTAKSTAEARATQAFRDAEYIATCNPAAVLELISEAERLRDGVAQAKGLQARWAAQARLRNSHATAKRTAATKILKGFE